MEGTRPRRIVCAAFALVLAHVLALDPARAEDSAGTPEPDPGALSTLAAIVPGFVVSGTGTYVSGDKRAARGIVKVQLAGLGLAAAGGIPMLLTGASRRTTGFTMPLIVTGGGLFLTSWIADIYGASTGGRDVRAFPAPKLVLTLGYAYVPDPQFDYDHFAVVSGDFRRGAWRGTPSAWIAVDDDVQRLRAEGAWRFRETRDGSYLEAETAATFHRHGDDDFEVYTGEISILARYDMAHLGLSLRGSFLEAGLGLGLETYTFEDDVFVSDLPLARAAYGWYLSRGEAQIYYDHRHDEVVGGLGIGSTFDGPYGHFGAQALYWLTDTWGVEAQFEVGSVTSTRLSVKWGLP